LRHVDRHDFRLEAAVLDRLRGTALTLGCERILIDARHAVAARNLFGRDPHVTRFDRAGEPFGEQRVDRFRMAHPIAPARSLQQVGRAGHGLGPAGHHDVNVADPQRFDRMHHRLQSGAADAIDRLARHVKRQPRLEGGLPRDVHAGARLKHAAEHDVADVPDRGAGPRDRLADHHRPEIGGRHILQCAPERPDRRPARAQDDCFEVLIHNQPRS
jgi:hypothetical protein